jgi:hypothetical protein
MSTGMQEVFSKYLLNKINERWQCGIILCREGKITHHYSTKKPDPVH